MSKNQVRDITPHPTTQDESPVLGLVPQRHQFSSERIFQQVMENYIYHLRRLEIIKQIEDCMKKRSNKS